MFLDLIDNYLNNVTILLYFLFYLYFCNIWKLENDVNFLELIYFIYLFIEKSRYVAPRISLSKIILLSILVL